MTTAIVKSGIVPSGPFGRFRAAVRADHAFMAESDRRYPGSEGSRQGSLVADAVTRVGFQLLVVVRLMHLLRDLRVPLGGQIVSRLIRHLYGAEIHWEAAIAPGIVVVHGNGVVISRDATVGPRCVLFQNITLGRSMGRPSDGEARRVGGPNLEGDVHVGPGAVLLGPITVGARTKIMANVTLDRSVPPDTVVLAPAPVISSRAGASDGE